MKKSNALICLLIFTGFALCIHIMKINIKNTYESLYPKAYAISEEFHQIRKEDINITQKEAHNFEEIEANILIEGNTYHRMRCSICQFEILIPME